MKFKTTNKSIKENYFTIYRVGYCSMYHLLSVTSPIAYTCGVYGWNADLYEVNGVAIVTGYRPGVGKQINYELLEKYESKAKAIYNNWDIPYNKRQKKIEKLLNEFMEKLEG